MYVCSVGKQETSGTLSSLEENANDDGWLKLVFRFFFVLREGALMKKLVALVLELHEG